MTIIVPTLDSRGWLEGPAEKADALMSYFLVSDRSQSNFFTDQVASLPWILQQNANNFDTLKTDIERTAERLFGNHFDNADVTAIIQEAPADLKMPKARYDLQLSVIVTQDGVSYSLGKMIAVVNSRISRVKTLEMF